MGDSWVMRGRHGGNLNTDLHRLMPGVDRDWRGSEAKAFAAVKTAALGDIDLAEAEAVEERGYGGAGVFAGCVEDAVGEGGLLELLLGAGAGVGLEVLVDRDEEAGGAGVDAGVLVVDAW